MKHRQQYRETSVAQWRDVIQCILASPMFVLEFVLDVGTLLHFGTGVYQGRN